MHVIECTLVFSLLCCARGLRGRETLIVVCLALQIVSVAKWHGSQVAELAQGIGKHVWVQLKDLASSSQAITLAQVGILPS